MTALELLESAPVTSALALTPGEVVFVKTK